MKLNHLALTGSPGVGKTTYVRKLVDTLNDQGITCSGFVTEEVREKGKRVGFDVVTLDGKRGTLSRNNITTVAGGKVPPKKNYVGQYVVDVKSFESLILPLFDSEVPENSVIVVDEIGKMEMFSRKFVNKLKELIKSSKNPMLVTIPVTKGRPIALVEEIRNHKDFNVQTISKINRDDVSIYENLVKYLVTNFKE